VIMAPTIYDYYERALENLKKEVNETADADVLGRDTNEWVLYLVQKYGMEPIEVDLGVIRLEETVHRGFGALLVLAPVTVTDTFEVIAESALAGGGQWLGFDYKSFFSHDRYGHIGQLVPQTKPEVEQARKRITQYVQAVNAAISDANRRFPDQVNQAVTAKQQAVRARHQELDALSAEVGIPIVKRADASTVIPTAVRVRQKIAPVLPPTAKAQQVPVLGREKFEAVVGIIDNQCRQFELTPSVFQSMPEEALRDVMLSSLNAVFEGAAGGELFRVLGKADIHLRISRGEVFIAELKIWAGPASLREVVGQLLDRLTWRDAHGVVIILSKNSDFGAVLASIEATLPTLPRVIPESFHRDGANIFATRFTLPSDVSTQVEVHVRAYNLFTPRTSARTS
jgi:hypothetical protein